MSLSREERGTIIRGLYSARAVLTRERRLSGLETDDECSLGRLEAEIDYWEAKDAAELATQREAPTATHRRPSSGAMRLELEKADTQPSPAPTEAGEAFRSATEKLGG